MHRHNSIIFLLGGIFALLLYQAVERVGDHALAAQQSEFCDYKSTTGPSACDRSPVFVTVSGKLRIVDAKRDAFWQTVKERGLALHRMLDIPPRARITSVNGINYIDFDNDKFGLKRDELFDALESLPRGQQAIDILLTSHSVDRIVILLH